MTTRRSCGEFGLAGGDAEASSSPRASAICNRAEKDRPVLARLLRRSSILQLWFCAAVAPQFESRHCTSAQWQCKGPSFSGRCTSSGMRPLPALATEHRRGLAASTKTYVQSSSAVCTQPPPRTNLRPRSPRTRGSLPRGPPSPTTPSSSLPAPPAAPRRLSLAPPPPRTPAQQPAPSSASSFNTSALPAGSTGWWARGLGYG
jgi:hypothetical protein